MRSGIALLIGFILALIGCSNDDGPSGSGHDPVVYHIGLLDYTFEEAAELAMPGDTLMFDISPPKLTNTIVFGENQTPLVLTATKDYPRIVAPDGLPALRFVAPKAGTRIERLAFSGGNATVSVSGSGSITIQDCKFQNAHIQLLASGQSLTVNASKCEFLRPEAFGIEVQSSTTLNADKVTIIQAGDCGILITGSATARVTNSIIYDAFNYGIACTGQGALAGGSGCNDIYLSTAVGDCTEPTTDFAADPLFCDPAHDVYTIMSISPCAPANSPPGCGQVGAYLPACDPPPPPP
jgi:Right handed beta helix region